MEGSDRDKTKRHQLIEMASHLSRARSVLDSSTSFNATLTPEQWAVIFINHLVLATSTAKTYAKSELDDCLPKNPSTDDSSLYQKASVDLDHIHSIIIQQLSNLKPTSK